jgi:hypothetical protein
MLTSLIKKLNADGCLLNRYAPGTKAIKSEGEILSLAG